MTFAHRALVFERDDDYAGTAVPFLEEGLAADETVLVVGSAARNRHLRRTLGGGAGAVEFHDSACWYSQPTRTIAAYCAFILDNPGARIRVVAEPDWTCGSDAEVAEWTRYESLVNQAFADIDASVLCAYDRRTAGPGIIDGVMSSHPELVGDAGPARNDAYRDPFAVFTEIDRRPLPPPPAGAHTIPVAGADLSELRCFVAGHARRHGMSPARLSDLLVSTTEIATNALRHGSPPVECRLWPDGDDLVAEVTDGGCWRPGQAPGFMPPDLGSSGFGLWGVRMLAPLVQLRGGPAGTTVRLRVPLR